MIYLSYAGLRICINCFYKKKFKSQAYNWILEVKYVTFSLMRKIKIFVYVCMMYVHKSLKKFSIVLKVRKFRRIVISDNEIN